jgi:hypothetical protein
VLLLLEDSGYLIDLMMSRENLLNKYLMIINNSPDYEKNLRIDLLFSLVYKLERNSFTNDLLSRMLQKVYAHSKSSGGKINSSLELKIASHLMSCKKYNIQDA